MQPLLQTLPNHKRNTSSLLFHSFGLGITYSSAIRRIAFKASYTEIRATVSSTIFNPFDVIHDFIRGQLAPQFLLDLPSGPVSLGISRLASDPGFTPTDCEFTFTFVVSCQVSTLRTLQ